MKIKQTLIAIIIFITSNVIAQNINVIFRSQLQYTGETLANICGYVDSLGNEYALVGASHGMSIVNINNPSAPV